ncbi:RNA polymerase sigma factor SigE [Lolliginicoccus levis]|uniref:RNA polymerase sigma factor SigE n=1 Tax=Lolliginicoccus levis TaxID=2919542 RepID=UPI0035A241AF
MWFSGPGTREPWQSSGDAARSDAAITEVEKGPGEQGRGGTAAFDTSDGAVPLPSWDEIVREHADRVYRLAYRLSGNAHDAEDLTQETFIRVFKSLSSYQPGVFEGWLHRITTNLFLDMVRRRSRIRMEALPEDYDRVPSDTPDPQQVYHDTHLDPHVQRALDSLAPEYRAAVVLCDIEGLSYEEIAATLGVKLGTVRSRIHRGRQALRDSLEHMGVLGSGSLVHAASGHAGS